MPRAFSSLRHRNFRLFLSGQFISLCGTWMQVVAQGWLVLQLTNSPFQVGLVSTLGALPVLLFTLYGGVLADRVNRRPFIVWLQSGLMVEALLLGVLTVTGHVTVHWVMGLALLAGTLSAFEIPARQSFLTEMVERDDIVNAVALNSTIFNVTRVIGPAIAGTLIAAAGIAVCFFVNAGSFMAVIAGLLLMRFPGNHRPHGDDSAVRATFRDGMTYVFGERLPRLLTILTAVFGVFGFSFIVMLPVFARDTLRVGSAGYGALLSAVGVGATLGAVFVAAYGHRIPRERLVFPVGVLYSVLLLCTAFAPSFPSALVLLTLTGCSWVLTAIMTNTLLQSLAPDRLRGRVMGFYSFVVVGLAPFGSLQAGWVAEHVGVRISIAAGAGVCVLAAITMLVLMSREEGEERKGTVRG